MKPGIIGKKLGMTQIFNETGQIVPVTVIQAGPCIVVQRKTSDKDGYEAIQIGYVDPSGVKGEGKSSRISRAERMHAESKGVQAVRVLRELKVEKTDEAKPGDQVLVSSFQEKALVHVTGVSKGKGFGGVVKRHHFGGGRATHGSMHHRAPGSIGGSSNPSRVFPGMRMAGHMGHEQVTVRNLEIAKIDSENNLLLIKGAIPGPKGGYVVIRQEA
jgi:large subunit ribosomal protein L3